MQKRGGTLRGLGQTESVVHTTRQQRAQQLWLATGGQAGRLTELSARKIIRSISQCPAALLPR